MLSLKSKADWDNLWAPGFEYGPIESWSSDLFLTIGNLLKDTPNPRILSAGCGRGLIDYWLVKVFGYHVTFLDYSAQCVKNLKLNLKNLPDNSYEISHASIFDIPYDNASFDLVWNEGVLEHFSMAEYSKSLKEMARVSRKYVLVDVPNANCKPYVLAKTWLEKNNLWGYGHENPRKTLKQDFQKHGIKVISEKAIGNKQTIINYINMVPAKYQSKIIDKLQPNDYKIFPHLMTIGKVK